MSLSTHSILDKPEVVTYVMKTRTPKSRRPMHCVNCGYKLLYTYKQVAMVIQGSPAAPDEVLDEIKCSKCPQIIEIC